MTQFDDSLFAAFREDHATLGRDFHELSQCLRAGDVAGALAAARTIDATAGAHIAFEEQHFYPVLTPLLGEPDVHRMCAEHRGGLEAIRALLNLRPDEPLDPKRRERLLHLSEEMESHVAECGELFETIGRIPLQEQAALHRELLAWRERSPRWTDYADAHPAPGPD